MSENNTKKIDDQKKTSERRQKLPPVEPEELTDTDLDGLAGGCGCSASCGVSLNKLAE